jgi:hypothetical protein
MGRRPGLSDYLRSPAAAKYRAGTPKGFCERLVAADVRTLDGLLRWTRERYPDDYKRYHFLSDGTGREIMPAFVGRLPEMERHVTEHPLVTEIRRRDHRRRLRARPAVADFSELVSKKDEPARSTRPPIASG